MKKITFGLLLFMAVVVRPGNAAFGQGHSGTEPWHSAKVFTSLEEALLQPDSVYKLRLARKKLEVFPKEIFLFKNLHALDLSRNRINHIPPSIGSLSMLNELNLSKNRLTWLPPELGQLTQLNLLDLNRNKITALPPEIGDLVNLQTLELWDNELDTVPDEISHLKKLQKLELRGILFSDAQQDRISSLLPHTRIYFSPSCACKE